MVHFCKSSVCLNGKTTIVTGANTGLGYYTALDFAKRGARVILACRSQERANAARDNIVEATGNENVVVQLLDLSSLESVRNFAKTFKSTEDRLDILVNNAGAAGLPTEMTEDGLQLEVATNYFGPVLLTHLLIVKDIKPVPTRKETIIMNDEKTIYHSDLMKKSAPSRIINVASVGAKFTPHLDVSKLNEHMGEIWLYSRTKLCNIYFTQVLAKKLEGTGVTTYSLHPGSVNTDFARFSSALNFVATKLFLTSEEGAQTQIYLSVEKGIEEYNGRHFDNCKPVKDYYNARNRETAEKLWRVTESFVRLTENEKI